MHPLEPTRIRKHGTRVTRTKDGDQIIAACRSIVSNGQYERINGRMVDLFTASAIVKVYDAVNDANRAKLKALPIERLALVAYKILA